MGVLVFDAGTSRVKCALLRNDLSRAVYRWEKNRWIGPAGAVDLEGLYGALLRLGGQTVETAAGGVNGGESIDAIAVTAIFGHAYLDRRGNPLGAAAAYSDRSAAEECLLVTEAARRAGALLPRPVTPDLLLPRLLRMRATEPERFGSLAAAIGVKDYLLYRLTGAQMTDIAHADYSLLYDLHGRPQEALLAELVLQPPETGSLRLPQEIAGTLQKAAAERLGLLAGIPVAVGSSDGTAAMYGGGVLAPEAITVTTGTTDVAMTRAPAGAVDRVEEFVSRGLSLNRCALEGEFLLGGSTSASGGAYQWLVTLLGEEAAGRWGAVEPGAHGLFCLPALNGERAPFARPDARGGFLGLTTEHRGEHLLRALLEGTTFRLAELISILADSADTPRQIYLGGGAHSPALQRMRAAVLDQECRRLEEQELSLSGTAMFALAASSHADLEALSTGAVSSAWSVQAPEPLRKRYREIRESWRRLLPHFMPEGSDRG